MFRKKFIINITLLMTALLAAPASAVTVDEHNSASVGSPAEESVLDENDFIMPTLEELLGEPVDNLGYDDEFSLIKTDLVSFAKKHLGKRYRRGSSGPYAFDCSGFTSFVFRNFGMKLNHSSRSQGTQGIGVSLADAEVGDLIFFSGSRVSKTIGHVGMIVEVNKENGSVKFIHASHSKGINIDRYPDGGYYSRRFISVRRVLGTGTGDVAQN